MRRPDYCIADCNRLRRCRQTRLVRREDEGEFADKASPIAIVCATFKRLSSRFRCCCSTANSSDPTKWAGQQRDRSERVSSGVDDDFFTTFMQISDAMTSPNATFECTNGMTSPRYGEKDTYISFDRNRSAISLSRCVRKSSGKWETSDSGCDAQKRQLLPRLVRNIGWLSVVLAVREMAMIGI